MFDTRSEDIWLYKDEILFIGIGKAQKGGGGAESDALREIKHKIANDVQCAIVHAYRWAKGSQGGSIPLNRKNLAPLPLESQKNLNIYKVIQPGVLHTGYKSDMGSKTAWDRWKNRIVAG